MYILQYIYIAAKKKVSKVCNFQILPAQRVLVAQDFRDRAWMCPTPTASASWNQSHESCQASPGVAWYRIAGSSCYQQIREKKQNVKLQQPNLKEIYHQQLCFAADEIGNKTLTPSSNELSLFVKSTNIKLFPWCLWRTSHRTWPLGCWDNESTGNLLDINWTLATWVCLKIVYPFLPNG